jgi:hypothetical protein
MSRTTSSQPKPTSAHSSSIPHEKIALRAYEKWVKRGRPAGTDLQDWIEAEAELKAEMGRSTTSTSSSGTTNWQSQTGQRF